MLAAVALTPGMVMERIVRPLAFTTIGVILGAGIALSIVAIGFGGPVKPRTFSGAVAADDIYDGDTFWLGDVSLRLVGVDAPERSQLCVGPHRDCGEDAKRHLAGLLNGALVQCRSTQNSRGAYVESFGRPLVQCEVRPSGGDAFDLGERMIQDGYAIFYRGRSRAGSAAPFQQGYADAENAAIESQAGLFSGCILDPKVWRGSRSGSQREAFEQGRIEGEQTELIGRCR